MPAKKPTPTKQSPRGLRPEDVVLAASLRARPKQLVPQAAPADIFRPAAHPCKPTKEQAASMALDSAFSEGVTNGFGSWAMQNSQFAEGVVFMGYPYLAAEAQRGEQRALVETICDEMTRKFIRIKATAEDEDKADRIAELTKEMQRLKVQKRFNQAAKGDGYFGRGQLFLDFGDKDANELKLPIGDATESGSKAKVGPKHRIQGLKYVEAMWSYPLDYNAVNPLAEDWYKPRSWLVMSQAVHASRMLTMIGREVPDILKPSYAFGGLSLTQIAKPYVDNWLRTRQSVSDLVKGFSVFVMKTDMSAVLQGGSDGMSLPARIDLFNLMRDNSGLMVIGKNGEELTNVSAPLGTLDALQAQSQEHMAAIGHQPLIKFLGLQPAGLNADSDFALRCWYEYVLSQQENIFTDPFNRLFNLLQLGLWGEIDEGLTWEYEGLRELDPKEKAEKRKIEAETDDIYVANGTLSQLEVRKRLAGDHDTPYEGLDIDDLPELPGDGSDIDISGEGEQQPEQGPQEPEASAQQPQAQPLKKAA